MYGGAVCVIHRHDHELLDYQRRMWVRDLSQRAAPSQKHVVFVAEFPGHELVWRV